MGRKVGPGEFGHRSGFGSGEDSGLGAARRPWFLSAPFQSRLGFFRFLAGAGRFLSASLRARLGFFRFLTGAGLIGALRSFGNFSFYDW